MFQIAMNNFLLQKTNFVVDPPPPFMCKVSFSADDVVMFSLVCDKSL